MFRNFDSMNIVAKKNNVDNAQLKKELNRIAREEVIEIRMHNVAKQRFKHKFAKLDVFAEKKGTEPSDVVMYQSHNPGFCYRRNGECRMPQSNITNLSVDFEDIHKLVFTDNEVDIEKVLFLYLLSTHRTNTLSPPPRSQKTSFLTREQSPLERLVDRSKKRQCPIYFPKNFPLYILEIPTSAPVKPAIQDTRLAGKVIVNEKILQLVQSVMVALKSANSARYEEVISLAQDINALKDTTRLTRMCRFTKMLEGQNLISSCESFYLISPSPKHNIHKLVIQPHFSILEKLISNIRKNIFIIPSTNTFNALASFEESSADDNESHITNETNKFGMATTFVSSCPSEENLTIDADPDINQNRDDVTSILTLPTIILPRKRDKFAFKAHEIISNMNLVYGSNYDLSNPLQESSNSTIPEINLDLEKIATMLNKKVQKAIKRDQEQLESSLADMDDTNEINNLLGRVNSSITPNISITENSSLGSNSNQTCAPKFLLRKTFCEACKHKWRTPLPAPKISKLKKMSLPYLPNESFLNISTPSAMQLSSLIDDEYKRWENVSRKSSKYFEAYSSKCLAKGRFVKNYSIEVVNIDELHLAKIRQEVKENETRKRLWNFLNL